MFFICSDDQLNQLMADYIFISEIDKFYILEVRKDSLRLDQSASFSRREINLGNVAGDHGFRTKSDAGQKHLHLLARGVLCLIKNDERIWQGSPRMNANGATSITRFSSSRVDTFIVDQIKKSVIKRS